MYLSKKSVSLFRRSLMTSAAKRDFRAAVVLSGAGVYDGSEITESVAMLIELSKN